MSAAAESRSNAAEYTVSEISNALKRTVEDAFGYVRVRGEISGYRGPHSSGHAYFALKDQGAKIDAVVWRTSLLRLKFRPEEGLEVIATGRLTTFPGKSSYQIVIDNLEPAGAGALMALLEERRKRLQAEGLFDAARKRRLPFMPAVIGVVTSPTGAVIRDILHRIRDRFPLHVLVWAIRVQGETAGAEAAAAVAGLNALPRGGRIPRPDVLIVARGGGSLEDLWGFNDEALARAVAASAIPVIAAVGHETDWTLVDHAADIRAPTPTAAAEMAVPVKADLRAGVSRLLSQLRAGISRGGERRRKALRAAERALPSAEQLLALPRRRLDEAGARLDRALASSAERNRARLGAARLYPAMLEKRLDEARRRLRREGDQLPRCAHASIRHRRQRFDLLRAKVGPELLARHAAAERRLLGRLDARLDRAATRLVPEHASRFVAQARRLRIEPLQRRLGEAEARRAAIDGRVGRATRAILARHRQRLAQDERLLVSYSYEATLNRGFVLVRGTGNRPVTRAGDLVPGNPFTLQFADGTMPAIATGEVASRPRAKTLRAPPPGQGSLF